jgi:carbonic anhydrase
LADNWVRHVQDVRDKHREFLAGVTDTELRWQRLCDLNVVEQAVNVARTTIVRDAWARGQELTVHGWVYGLADGLLRDLKFAASRSGDIEPVAGRALALIRNA